MSEGVLLKMIKLMANCHRSVDQSNRSPALKDERMKLSRSWRHYFGLVFCIGLLLATRHSAFAQDAAGPETVKSQVAAEVAERVKTPIKAEIANQPDSPLFVSLIGVDATNEQFQKINLTIQNVSEKSIRGYVLATTYGNVGGQTTTSFFPAKPSVKGAASSEVLAMANENTRLSPNLTVFIDYVLFTDGSEWGADVRKMSDQISGMTTGAFSAAGKVSESIALGDLANLDSLVGRPSVEVDVVFPPEAEKQSDIWRRGFRSGYRSFIHFVQVHRKDPDFPTQLSEFRSQLQQEQRVK